MTRVYSMLKARVIAGDFTPGERLEPSRLALELHVSATPVRDALHRLTGERLIESLHQEGFRQPHVSERAIRDLYRWAADVMPLITRAAGPSGGGHAVFAPTLAASYAARIAACFDAIASWSSNSEHGPVVASLNDRLALYRSAECDVLPDAMMDLEWLERDVQARDISALAKLIQNQCRKRVRVAEDMATILLNRRADG